MFRRACLLSSDGATNRGAHALSLAWNVSLRAHD